MGTRNVPLEVNSTLLASSVPKFAAAAETFPPEGVEFAFHANGAVERTPASSRLAVLRRAR